MSPSVQEAAAGYPSEVDLVDIRGDKTNHSLLGLIQKALHPGDGETISLPTLLLYDEKGLKLFEKITYLDEYYLTNAEIDALTRHADTIASFIPDDSRLVELGSGNLRKVNILLQAFERAHKKIEYCALDLSSTELQRTFADINIAKYEYVTFKALHGTYDDGLEWIANPVNKAKTTCVMTLGSSIGNFTREEAAEFLASFKSALGPQDLVLVGLDACQDHNRVFAAYNDSKRLTERFYRNGLDHANDVLGYPAFKQEDWLIEGIYVADQDCHRAAYVALKDISTKDFTMKKGEKLHLESAYKYSADQSDRLWRETGLILQMTFPNSTMDYNLHLLSPCTVKFSSEPLTYAKSSVPTASDWQNLWAAWDTVTKAMVPRDELLNKPIQLRNNLIFYLGHIPTFADIHYTRALGAKPTDPAYFYSIFERGIDPDVDNPEQCHDHSEIPDEWPPLPDILAYQQKVRNRIMESLESGIATSNRRLSRAIWIAYEHEAMHLETFLYMLLQSEKVLPPPTRPVLDFQALARDAASLRDENKWHDIPANEIIIGSDDPENDLPPDRYFVWDNERPARKVQVNSFQAQSRCISNGEYAKFLEDTKCQSLPASWMTVSESSSYTNGAGEHAEHSKPDLLDLTVATPAFLKGKMVRTVYGPVPLEYALDWPVMASYDELAAFAKWSNGRIPTLEEARSIYDHVEKQAAAENISSGLVPAVNGHLSNDGVEETPPSNGYHDELSGEETGKKLNTHDNFINLQGCNVAFEDWHPTAITGDGGRLRGQSDAGGLWEWTSSALASYEGFKAMDLYPGYTSDFFDGKHNICLGGSWATVPRIAGRRSFVNWYQKNYPYVWCTARLARDVA